MIMDTSIDLRIVAYCYKFDRFSMVSGCVHADNMDNSTNTLFVV